MAALWLARASSQLARRAARRLPPVPLRHGGEPNCPRFLGAAAAPPPVLGSPPLLPAVERVFRRGFCSVRRFAGESSAAAAAAATDEEEPENGLAGGDQVGPRPPSRALASAVQHAS
jgi:2-oxoisovalerate dehydrogenase E1 component alpha subunit